MLPPWHPDKQLLLPGEVGPYLKHFYSRGVSAATVYRWFNEGAELADGSTVYLKATNFMGRKYVSKHDLLRFLEIKG